jgi:parallel beta-helix repeat protein
LCAISSVNSYAATVYVPAGANIQDAVNANPPGTVFQLAAGLYRQQTVEPKADDQIIGALDGNGNRLTILNGAQLLTAFTRDQFGNYVASTTQREPGQQTGECLAGYSRCSLPEDLFYDNEPYLHSPVGGAALAPGQWYFDYPAGRIYFRPRNSNDDPARHLVEYSQNRAAVLGPYSPNVAVRNLIVEKYASPNQFGAIGHQYPATGWVVQNNEVRWNHGAGIRLGTDGRAIDNFTHDNGTMGFMGTGRNLLVQGNEIGHNAHFIGTYCEFECGGAKFTGTDGLVVRGNYSHDNFGAGLWTDLDNIRTLYEDNTVTNNVGPGIFHEISYDAVMRNNTIRGNKRPVDDWFWNAQILVSTSQGVEAYGNKIQLDSETSANGIMLIQQDRRRDPCSLGPCRVINNWIHDNHITVTGNRRHGSTGAEQDFAGLGSVYDPKSNNRFDYNHYHVANPKSDAYWYWIQNFQFWNWLLPLQMEVHGTVDSNISGDFSAPSVPSALAATPSSDSSINLTWTASNDDVGVTGYTVYRNGGAIGTASSTSWVDSGLSAGVNYTYTVAAVDAAGNSSAQSATSAATIVVTAAAPPAAPPAPAPAVMQVGARVVTTSASTIGNQPLGAVGTIRFGPISVPGSPVWWFVDFDSGMNGFVNQNSLRVF